MNLTDPVELERALEQLGMNPTPPDFYEGIFAALGLNDMPAGLVPDRPKYSHLLAEPSLSYGELTVAHDVLAAKIVQLQQVGLDNTQPPFFRERRQAMEILCRGFAERLNRLDAERELLTRAQAVPPPATATTPASVEPAPVPTATMLASVTEEPLALWVEPLLPFCRLWAVGFGTYATVMLNPKPPENKLG